MYIERVYVYQKSACVLRRCMGTEKANNHLEELGHGQIIQPIRAVKRCMCMCMCMYMYIEKGDQSITLKNLAIAR